VETRAEEVASWSSLQLLKVVNTVNGLHSKVTLIGRPLRLQGCSECPFHSSFAAVATFEGDTVSEKGRNFERFLFKTTTRTSLTFRDVLKVIKVVREYFTYRSEDHHNEFTRNGCGPGFGF
jgi:hypothetical protein